VIHQALEALLSEPVSCVRERERTTLERLLKDRGNKVVLFGAGNLGKRSVACLRTIGIEPLALSDNNPNLWGTSLDGVPILEPRIAAERFGAEALFIVTMWNTTQWYTDRRQQLMDLGCRYLSPVSPLYWRFPDTFLPFFAQDLPHKVYESSADVMKAADIWADDRSREEYLKQVRWRTLADWDFIRHGIEESYFPDRIFHLSPQEAFVDCGAFDGDTIRSIVARRGADFQHIVAIEPDPGTFQTLRAYSAGLPDEIQNKITFHQCAVGAERGVVRFEDSGSLGSRVSDDGQVTIDSIPISDIVGSLPVSYIKMDIEGAEFDALVGAQRVIERDRPLLAICVYHRQDDLWRLPLLMKKMLPDHRFYLRLHESDGWQTVAYAVPPSRVIAA